MTAEQALDKIERYHDELVYDVGATYVVNIFGEEITTIREKLDECRKLWGSFYEVAKKLDLCIRSNGKENFLDTPDGAIHLTDSQFSYLCRYLFRKEKEKGSYYVA